MKNHPYAHLANDAIIVAFLEILALLVKRRSSLEFIFRTNKDTSAMQNQHHHYR